MPINSVPPLNGDRLKYRIGTSDRPVGAPTSDIDGFLVLNQTNNKVFKSQGGVWVEVDGTFPNILLQQWFATVPGTPPPGEGYRIGTSDRSVGSSTTTPDGFFVLNTTNNKVFEVVSGVWQDVTSTFDSSLLTNIINAWKAA
jgi:hypothetical protein